MRLFYFKFSNFYVLNFYLFPKDALNDDQNGKKSINLSKLFSFSIILSK